MITRLRLYLAFPLAALSGLALSTAFPAASLWIMAFVGLVLLLWSLLGQKFWTSFLLGLIAGATFWLNLINWLTLYLGPVPWLALGILQAIFFACGVALMSLVVNRGPKRWPHKWGRYVIVPVVIAAIYTLRESITSVWPYGGFSWGRLAHSQSESPLVHLVTYIGTAGLSFFVALVAALLFQVLRSKNPFRKFLLPGLLVVAALVIPAFPVTYFGTSNILAVQGDSQAGLFSNNAPGEIMQDHIAGTLPYSGKDVDIVVWPENATDIDPLRNEYSAQALEYVSGELKAPIVTGAITHPSSDEYFNSSLVWSTEGLIGQYDKIHPVPFAEYMPNRTFWRLFAPDLVDLVQADYTAGTRPNVIQIDDVLAGVSICFDITDDQQAYQMIEGGAQIIFAQTNNADFGETQENVQQLAIARLRAVETGRSVINISTVGTSAIILPSGETLSQIAPYEPGAMLESVPLSTTITPSMILGRFIEISLGIIAVLGLVLVLVRTRKN